MSEDLVRDLKLVGLETKSYSEVVATFIGKILHTMPIGIKLLDDGRIWFRVFKSSRVYRYIVENFVHSICICITHNPIIFFKAVLKKKELEYRDDKCVAGCDAYVYCDIVEKKIENDYVVVIALPKKIFIEKKAPDTLKRANFAIVEALIVLTKMWYLADYRNERFLEYLKLLRECVYRSTEDQTYRRIIDDILEIARASLSKT